MTALLKDINRMTKEDKLAAIDMLWTSILSSTNDLEPPAWHEAVLNERRRRVAAGEEHFIPWEEAKLSLLAEFS